MLHWCAKLIRWLICSLVHNQAIPAENERFDKRETIQQERTQNNHNGKTILK